MASSHPCQEADAARGRLVLGIRVGVLLLVALALFGVLAFRLWFLQILSGDEYVSYARNNRSARWWWRPPGGSSTTATARSSGGEPGRPERRAFCPWT